MCYKNVFTYGLQKVAKYWAKWRHFTRPVFLVKGNVSAESYYFFINILLDTLRSEIAACLEKAYEKISLNEAARMLNFTNQTAIKEYGVKKNWTLGRDNYYYFGTEEKKHDDTLPSSDLAKQAFEYARELEMIV